MSAIESVARTTTDTTDVTLAVTASLARNAATLKREHISADAWRVARHCLLDWFGVGVAGAAETCVTFVRDEAVDQAGKPQASLLAGDAGRLPAAAAALVNGTASHALDFDDVNYHLHGHATVAIAPAIMALAQARGLSLEQALVGFVAGVEFACDAARYIGGDHYLAGWHATSTIGALGAAAGCARLLALDSEQTAHAVGLAATQTGGLKSMFGTMAKPFHAGRAARSGIESASWVERGFMTRSDSLECTQGLAAVMHGLGHQQGLQRLQVAQDSGRMRIQDTLFKYHASCFETHATIEACRQIAKTTSLEAAAAPEAVERVEVFVRPANFEICNIVQPASGLEAKFSLTQTAAMALMQINTGNFHSFNDDVCANPATTALREKTLVIADDAMKSAQARVQITLHQSRRGSKRFEQFHDASIPATDLDDQEQRLVDKFNAVTAPEETATESQRVVDSAALQYALIHQDPNQVDVDALMEHAQVRTRH